MEDGREEVCVEEKKKERRKAGGEREKGGFGHTRDWQGGLR